MGLTKRQVSDIAKNHELMIREDFIEFNESGLDFQVVFANDMEGEQWVLRIPRRADVIAHAVREKKTLDLVSPHLSVSAPKWEVFSDELIAYKILPGIPAGTVDPEKKSYVWEIDEENVPIIYHETLARAMASLHQINRQYMEEAGMHTFSISEIRDNMRHRIEKVEEDYGVAEELWNRWQAWLNNDSLWPESTALVHGDLHPGHILIDHTSRVTGLIDWTEARVDDPATDFVAHYMAFGEDALNRLIEAYDKAGGYVWPFMAEHVKELQAAYPVTVAEFAERSGSGEFANLARQLLGVENK
ncbi:macrolide 2'-phosphotransferase [Virgibacillus xinjiangensis]|uniref:Macrolide 2'-phosphotransferase n=1 Tax=Virgibacillus xinjiangensis TaxID=393090 RepID=A0ABV7CZH5_9BACI